MTNIMTTGEYFTMFIVFVIFYFIFIHPFYSKLDFVRQRKYDEGYEYASNYYMLNVKCDLSHSDALEKLYNDADTGLTFSTSSLDDYFDRGIKNFIHHKRVEGFVL